MAGRSRSTNIPYRKFKDKDFPTYQSLLSSSSTSSSLSNPEFKYDVFLSFRGEDTRKNFTDHLYKALDGNGITTFKDDEELDRGKDISPELLKAIEESRFSLIVLSTNYAASRWCLDELVHILECMKPRNSVIPIFYYVDPSAVRHHTDSYAKAFSEHKEKYNQSQQIEKVHRWRFALVAVANLSGWHLKDGRESEFIQNIVQDVSRRLNDTPEELISNPNDTSQDNSGLVGMGSRVRNLMFHLDLATDDVRMIGVCGMGEIDMTTIARVVYEELFDKFDGCCFLGIVRQLCSLVDLQKHLLSELMGTKMFVSDVHHGIWLLRKMFRYKKVLIVLDDVFYIEQLEALVGEAQWFGIGSRIIITTRNLMLLASKGVKTVYTCEELSHDEATQLFNFRAFKQKHPATGYEEISNRFVKYTSGHPLVVIVMGSFLYGRTMNEWKS